MFRNIYLLIISLFLLACQDGDLNLVGKLAPDQSEKSNNNNTPSESIFEGADLKVVEGNYQSALIDQWYDAPVSVQLKNKNGPLQDQTVVFEIEGFALSELKSTERSLFSLFGLNGSAKSLEVKTDTNGFASVMVKASLRAGEGSISARVLGTNLQSVYARLETKEPSYELKIVSGNFQSSLVGVSLPEPLKVSFLQNGSPVANEEILFEFEGFAGGHLSESRVTSMPSLKNSNTKVKTNRSGEASVHYLPDMIPRVINITAVSATANRRVTFRIETLDRGQIPPPPFDGCVDGRPIDTSRILINFTHPADADGMRLYRNGILVVEFRDRSVTTFIDSRLIEGEQYLYSCNGIFGDKEYQGTRKLSLSTRLENAPTFEGIQSLTLMTAQPGKLLARWKAPRSEVAATLFKVFATPGDSPDFVQTIPVETAGLGATEAVISGLGDELPYTIHVRACSVEGLCELNSRNLTIVNSDTGAPQTPGITEIRIVDRSVVLTAPWNHRMGRVAKRNVLIRRGGDASNKNINTFTAHSSITVGNPLNVPTNIVISNLQEGFVYHFYVIDEDPAGQKSTNESMATISIEDLTPPNFFGVTALNLGTNQEIEIVASFNAIQPETIDVRPAGASFYLAFVTSAPFPNTPSDPCLKSDPDRIISALDYQSAEEVRITFSGLTPRTTYRVCVKAKDLVGNGSETTESRSVTTKDLHPPQFDGLKSFSYNGETKKLQFVWDNSLSDDVSLYRLRLWKNQANPPESAVTTVDFSPNAVRDIGANQFLVVDGDFIYATATVCDNADVIPNGIKNCRSFSEMPVVTLSIPDTTPPPNFLGVTLISSNTEGSLTVNWGLPTDDVMADHYRGFLIYNVLSDGSLSFLEDVNCAALNPLNRDCKTITRISSSLITGLSARRTYNVHVRAYDAVGNVTVLDPTQSVRSARTQDQTPPTVSNIFNMGSKPSYTLSWGSAQDNQYQEEPGAVLTYQVYRKRASAFSIPSQPELDSLKVMESSVSSFTDNATLVEGDTYYYAYCVIDASNNRACNPTPKSRLVEDFTPPTISALSVNRVPNAKTWRLQWSHSDNIAVTRYQIFERISSDAQATPSKTDKLVDIGNGATMMSASLNGPKNLNVWVNYLVVVSDANENESSAIVSVRSDNLISIISITRNNGKPEGGNLVLIQGQGLSDNASVKVGGKACLNTIRLNSNRLLCKVPASDFGSWNTNLTIEDFISDSEGSSFAGVSYSYDRTSTCNNSSSGDFSGGVGSESLPYVICTPEQLRNISLPAYRDAGLFFAMGDHLDFSGYSSYLPVGREGISFKLNGNDFIFYDYNYAENANNVNTGLFGWVKSGSAIRNLELIDFDVTSNGTQSGTTPVAGTGAFAGTFVGTMENIVFDSDVTAQGRMGGLIGRINGTSTINNIKGTARLFNGIAGDIGGIVGYLESAMTTQNIDVTMSYATSSLTSANLSGVSNLTVGNVGGIVGRSKVASAVTLSFNGIKTTIDVKDDHAPGSGVSTNVISQNWGGILGGGEGGGITITSSSTSGLLRSYEFKGGLIGGFIFTNSPLAISKSSSSVNITTEHQGSGGLVGRLSASLGYTNTFVDSYYSGSILCSPSNCPGSSSSAVGGILGTMINNSIVEISRVYVSGAILNNSTTFAGTIVGSSSLSPVLTIRDSFWYWDPATPSAGTTRSNAVGSGFGGAYTPMGVVSAKSQAQMFNRSTFESAGWTFGANATEGVWGIASGLFPYLN